MERTRELICSVTLAASLMAQPAWAEPHDGWKKTADYGRAGLVGIAFLAAAAQEDWEGVKQAGLSIGATAGATYLLKETFPEDRPNGHGDDSFPSGHTSISFSSAAFLHQRYGWKAGLPAYAVAATVGWARVESKHHHWYDVVVGAALGTATSFLLTEPLDERVQLTPWADSKGGGVALAVKF